MERKRNRKYLSAAGAFSCFLLVATGTVARAVEIKFLCPGALSAVMGELVPQFERSSGHKVTTVFGPAGQLFRRVQQGDAADVVIASQQQIEDLQKQGRVTAGSRVEFARVAFGIGVPKGTRKPDISSVDAVKRSLITAKSIVYPDPALGGPVSIYAESLIQRLGLAEVLKSKTKGVSTSAPSPEAIARGEFEIVFGQVNQQWTGQGLDFVGPMPLAIAGYINFAGGLVASSEQTNPAGGLIQFISSPAAKAVMKAKGFEPLELRGSRP
jgi:molybdate transport system substrate-binding protein